VAALGPEDGLKARALPGAHPHFLDDEVAGLRFESADRRRAPAATHHGLVIDDALEQRRVERQSRRAWLDNKPDVDHDDAAGARRGGEATRVLNHVLLTRMRGRPG